MTDHISNQFSADKVQAILNNHSMKDDEKIAEIKAMLSTLKSPTLADMPDEDRRTLTLADVIRAISEEKDAWGRGGERHDRPRKSVMHRTIGEDRRDMVNLALLNVLDRLVANLEKA